MKGIDYHKHPKKVMGKGKDRPCGRRDKDVQVWDYGNGYMFLGSSDIDQCRRVLEEYVDNPEDYRFAGRPGGVEHEGRYVCRVWLTRDPGAIPEEP